MGRNIATSALLPSDSEHCRQLLEPWVISAMPSTSSRWRKIIAKDTRHWRIKVLKRRLKGLLSGNLSSALRYRTADHVKKTYGRTWSGESLPSLFSFTRLTGHLVIVIGPTLHLSEKGHL